jgi:hypothetical protein
MSQEESGKYASKHPADIKPDEKVAKAIQARLTDGRLSCAAATKIADELGISLADVGRNADLQDIRITKCLMGLFGYFTPEGKKIKPTPAESVPKAVEEAIRVHLKDGVLTCADAWKVAKITGTPRKEFGPIAGALKIKIKPCQLGAF